MALQSVQTHFQMFMGSLNGYRGYNREVLLDRSDGLTYTGVYDCQGI
jgi:hypothetical protein